ncbi:YqaE/Pmp3 family membrane protein [bacterium]|nr:YqaE/Pmp3 family membrane protein [bacterium]
MRYLLAIVLPPLAVLLCGKPLMAVLNLLLTIAGILPGIIHALFVVNSHHADKRNRQLVRAMRR